MIFKFFRSPRIFGLCDAAGGFSKYYVGVFGWLAFLVSGEGWDVLFVSRCCGAFNQGGKIYF